MTKLDRSKTIRFLVFVVLVLGAASCSQKSPSTSEPTAKPAASIPEKTSAAVREQIAKTYGLDGFGTGRSDPIYVERTVSRGECLSCLGLGTQDRAGFL